MPPVFPAHRGCCSAPQVPSLRLSLPFNCVAGAGSGLGVTKRGPRDSLPDPAG